MARLRHAPRDDVNTSTSPLANSSHASVDGEAANRQLHSEYQVANPNLQPPSAVLGANLLNAARMEHRHSSPAGITRKNGAAKLKRPSLAAGGPRQNLALRGDVYEIELSPEKGRYALPEKVNLKPLKVVRKKKTAQELERSEDNVGVAQVVGDVDDCDEQPQPSEDILLPSSPPGVRPVDSDNLEAEGADEASPQPSSHLRKNTSTTQDQAMEHVSIREHLPNGKPQCTVTIYKINGATPHYQQCSLAGTNHTHAGPRCHTHLQKPGAVRCRALTHHGGTKARCLAKAQVGTTLCQFHASVYQRGTAIDVQNVDENKAVNEEHTRVEHVAAKKGKRKSGDTSDIGERRTKSPRLKATGVTARSLRKHAHPEKEKETCPHISSRLTHSQIQVHGSGNGRSANTSRHGQRKQSRQQTTAGTIAIVQNQSPTYRNAIRKAKSPEHAMAPAPDAVSDNASDKDDSQKDCAATEDQNHDVDQENSSDVEVTESAADNDDDPVKVVRSSDGIGAVFAFLKLEERPGKCRTRLGTTLKRSCDIAYIQAQGEDTPVDDIVYAFKDLRKTLHSVNHDLPVNERKKFKGDAFAYIFRALTLYLEAVYGWFDEKCDDVLETVEAMRILSPLMHDILAFKDTISRWNVSVPQRYKGDSIIKPVHSGLIAPLRQVHKAFDTRLSHLEAADKIRGQREKLKRKVEKEAEEEQRRLEAESAKKDRWERWQNLHIARMQCEPEPSRRRKLVIAKLDDAEIDANGVMFERLPVFKPRSTPISSLTSSCPGNHEWTNDEEIALIDGLQKFPGPRVFEEIFKTYCRSGGILRNFTVADIVAKAAWVRLSWLKLQQEKGWEMLDWVREIPELP